MDATYWKIHKKIYLAELDKLPSDIRREVLSNPESEEAITFSERIKRDTEAALGLMSPVLPVCAEV